MTAFRLGFLLALSVGVEANVVLIASREHAFFGVFDLWF
jgi:hypothetical protein